MKEEKFEDILYKPLGIYEPLRPLRLNLTRVSPKIFLLYIKLIKAFITSIII